MLLNNPHYNYEHGNNTLVILFWVSFLYSVSVSSSPATLIFQGLQTDHFKDHSSVDFKDHSSANISRDYAISLCPQVDPVTGKVIRKLKLRVPVCWWDGYRGTKLYDGYIIGFHEENYILVQENVFIFQLGGDSEECPMRYDAVKMYADQDHPDFHFFSSPTEQLQWMRSAPFAMD